MKLKITTYELPEKYSFMKDPDFYTVEHYNENGELTGKGYYGISEQSERDCPVKAVYIDDDAKRFLWRREYDQLNDTDRRAILAVFPDILERDAAHLKKVCEIVKIASVNILKHFGETCSRCGGSGSYAQSVAFTLVSNGICHKCGGRGTQLPRLTDKKVAEIAKFFTERRQGK